MEYVNLILKKNQEKLQSVCEQHMIGRGKWLWQTYLECCYQRSSWHPRSKGGRTEAPFGCPLMRVPATKKKCRVKITYLTVNTL